MDRNYALEYREKQQRIRQQDESIRGTEERRRERELYESIVHGLRMQGWSRIDAESEALDRIDRLRATNGEAD